jgi:Tfp pilus assembly protein PilF
MRFIACALFLATAAFAQMEMPAGTRSTVEIEEQQKQLQTAEELLQQNEAAKARDLLQSILAKDGRNARAAYDLGFADEALKDTTAAEAAYRSAIASDKAQFESRFALGMLLAGKGDNAGAREQLLAATERTPASGDGALKASAWRALAHLDAGSNNEAARTELLAALKLSPETAEDRSLAAQLAAVSGDSSSAEAAYRRVLAQSPGDSEATLALSHLLVQSKKPAEAEGLLAASLQSHPADPSLTAQLASLYASEGKEAEALPLLEAANTAHPDQPSLQRMLARLYVQTKQPEKSSPLYEALVKATPDDPELLDEWGSSLVQQKRSMEAEAVLKRAVAKPDAFSSKEALAQAAAHLAFAAATNQDPETTIRAVELRNSILAPSASSLFLAAAAHDRLHHNKLAVALYRQFLQSANGRYPNEEWEAKHRIPALEHAK